MSVVGIGTTVHAGHFGPMKDLESLGAIEKKFGLIFIFKQPAH